MRTIQRLALGALCAGICLTAQAQFANVGCDEDPSLVPPRGPAVCEHDPAVQAGELPLKAANAAVLYGVYVGGRTVSGPVRSAAPVAPPAWAVGVVAMDTYVMPKYSPGGCTPTSLFTMTDFNSPPRLLHYKNYLPPMPYTHPPVMPSAKAPFQVTQGPDMPSSVRTGAISVEY